MLEIKGVGPVVGSKGLVSFTTIGAAIGTVIPGLGTLIGAAVGSVIDVAINWKDKKKAKRKMKKALRAALIQRYHNTIFYSALQRMNEAMFYLVELGLKPGTLDYDAALRKKLFSEIGYEGGCSVKLYGPPPDRPLIAHIDKEGKVIASSGYVTQDLPGQWKQACQELHQATLKAWLEMQADEINFKKELQKEDLDAQKSLITRVMVNAGAIILLVAYSKRQKKKLKVLNESV